MTEKDRIYNKVKTLINEGNTKSSYIGEDDFVSLVKGGITINFRIKHPSLNIENTFRTVKRAQKIIKDKFDHNVEKIEISIYDSKEELRQEGRSKSRYASWIAGIYDGKIRIISEQDDDEPEALYIILTHEIIHLAIAEIGKGKCPYWLDEGIAVYLSQELSDDYVEILSVALKKDKILPLEILENPLPPDTPEDVRKLAYAEAMSITEYLIATYNWEKVKSIIVDCSKRPAKAVLGGLSLNYYLIEQGWKRWLKSRIA